MTRYLIVNADDLGVSPGVNQGILEAHQNGIVTSTTVMINLPNAEDGIRKIQEEAPEIGIGLHLNLTYGTPVLAAEKIPSMVLPDGIFPSIKEMIQSLTTYNGEEIQAEIIAQFEQFNRLAGIIPDHLDTHQFATNIHPAAFDTMLKLAAQYDIPLRNADNFLSLESLKRFIAIFQRGSIFVPNSENLKSDIQVQLLQEIYAANIKPRWPNFVDFRFFDKGVNLDTLIHILRNLPDGVTEIVCHPGYAEELDLFYREQREIELMVLTDSRIRKTIEQEGIELITFAQLPSWL